MKKLLFLLTLVALPSSLYAKHLTPLDASKLTIGILDPARVSPDTITMFGQNLPAGAIYGLPSNTEYNIVVGTPGTPFIDMAYFGPASFNVILASVAAMGTMYSSTISAKIYWKDGSYGVTGATLPQGVWMVGGSSAVWYDAGTTVQEMLRGPGRLTNIKLDLGGASMAVAKINPSSGSIIEDCTFYGTYNMPDTVIGPALIRWNKVTNCKFLRNKMLDPVAAGGVTRFGDVAPFIIDSSSDILVDKLFWRDYKKGTANTNTHWGIFKSSNIRIIDSDFEFQGSNGIAFTDGVVDLHIDRCRFRQTSAFGSDNGMIIAGGATGASIGVSSVSVTNCTFLTDDNATQSLIMTQGTTFKTQGFTIANNIAYNSGANTYTFIKLNSAATNVVIIGNSAWGSSTFLNDGGASTVKTGNYLNGVAQ